MTSTLKKALVAAGIGLAAAGITGCDTYDTLHEKEMLKRGHTQEEAEVLTAASYRRGLAKETKTADGMATYKPHYKVFSNKDILEVVEATHDDLLEIKDLINLQDLKYMQYTGVGEHIIKQEKIFKYHRDMLGRKVLHTKFKEMTNSSGGSGNYGYYWHYSSYASDSLSKDERYSLSTVFPFNQEDMEFEAEYVRIARKSDKLKDPATVVEDITEMKKFFEKVRNINYPLTDKSSEWVFKEINMGLRITSFNLDDDEEKETDYIEAYRITKEGKLESKPAIRIFKTGDGVGSLEVIVADKDLKGKAGYGIPDYVDNPYLISVGSDILPINELIDYIFQDLKKPELKIPDTKDMNKVYIISTGTVPAEKYDMNASGWESELPDYKTREQLARVSGHVMLDSEDEEKGEGKIKWIAHRYFGGQRVVEFYRPNNKFKDDIYSIESVYGRIATLKDTDGRLTQSDIKAICEEKPFRIDFDRSTQKRWRLFDLDDDKAHYEAKQEVAWSWNTIPKE